MHKSLELAVAAADSTFSFINIVNDIYGKYF